MKFQLAHPGIDKQAAAKGRLAANAANSVANIALPKEPLAFGGHFVDSPLLTLTTRNFHERMRDINYNLQQMKWDSKAFDHDLRLGLEGNLEHQLNVQSFVVSLLQSLRTGVQHTYNLMFRYLFLLRHGHTESATSFNPQVHLQIYILNNIVGVLMKDSVSCRYVSRALDLEIEHVLVLFRQAFLGPVQDQIQMILDNWCSSSILKDTRERLKLSSAHLSDYFSKSATPLAKAKAFLQNHLPSQHTNEDFDRPHMKQYYQALKYKGPAFYKKSEVVPSENWSYEGWTTDFAAKLKLEASIKKDSTRQELSSSPSA